MSGHCERVGAWTLGLSALGLALACQAKAPASAAPDPAQNSLPHSSPTVQKSEEQAAKSRISLSVAKAPAFRPATGLLDLEDGRRLSRAEFDALRLQPLSPEAVQATARGALFLSLDEQSPRPLLAADAPLKSVVDEDRELSPGWHVLVAFIRSSDEVLLGAWHFQIELDLPRPAEDAACVLLEPGGTVFSPAGGSVEFLAAPLVPEVVRFEYYLLGQSPALVGVPGLESVRASGLSSGDHRLGVRCYDRSSVLVGQSERIVTINADEGQKSQ